MTNRLLTLPLLAGTAAAALLLTACGADPATPPPAAPATSAAAPTSAAPTSAAPTSAVPSASASPSSSAGSSAAPASGPTVEDDRAELDVEDQRGDGRSVAVEEVRLTSGTGFVAVYTRDGELLGSAEVGRDRTLTVDLDDRIPASGEFRAVLFGDEGDGRFNPEEDPRVVEGEDDADDAGETPEAVGDEFDYTLN